MNRVIALLVFFMSVTISAQDVIGKWKTIDDATGEAKSIVEIYERDGKVFGKIIEILNPKNKNAICTKCEGDAKNKPILGFELIKDMEKDGKYYREGSIFHPENG